MKILSIVTSGLQEDSITYNSWKILESYPTSRKHTFEYSFFRNEIDTQKVTREIAKSSADLIVIQTSPFHGQLSSQLQMFLENCEESRVLKGRNVTVFDTCMRFFDTFMNNSLEELIKKAQGNYIPALSLGTSDMLNKEIKPYSISQPTEDYKPEKKKKFIDSIRTNEAKELANKLLANPPEGLKRAVSWLEVCDKLVNRDIPLVNPNVLIVKADSNAPDFKVENGRTICLSDYKFTGCDSCKLCYQTKTCRFNDDFSKIEEEISKADIVVFTGTLNCGTYRGGMFKRLLDRGVKNGLAPLKAKERKSQAFGYLVTNIEDASKSQFKEWLVGDCAYSQKHFIGVESANEESLNRMIDFAKILLDGKVMPQINGYSEKHGRYFADLSLSIPTILPQEKEYFESLGTFEPIMADAHSRPTADVKEYKKSAHGRTTPYRMYSGALKTLKTIE